MDGQDRQDIENRPNPVYPAHPCLNSPTVPASGACAFRQRSGVPLLPPGLPHGKVGPAAWIASGSRLKPYRVACFSLCLTHWRAANRIGSVTNRNSNMNKIPNETAISEAKLPCGLVPGDSRILPSSTLGRLAGVLSALPRHHLQAIPASWSVSVQRVVVYDAQSGNDSRCSSVRAIAS